MKDLETFIFVHDQDIVLEYNERNKFSDLLGFKWVFLGNRNYDKISDLPNVIVANTLPINIEDYPKFTSFTGWYALHKNGLLNSKYVNLFEYDIKYIDGFPEINKEMLNRDFDFIGYFPMSIHDVVYVKDSRYSIELTNSIKQHTDIDILRLIGNLPNQTNWSSSSNSTWKTSELVKYVSWFMLFFDDIKDSIYCGHMHERSLSFYYFINNLNVYLSNGLMFHAQLNSHGTSPLPKERAEQMRKLL